MYTTTITLNKPEMVKLKCETAHGIHSFVYSLFPYYNIGATRRPFSYSYESRMIKDSSVLYIYVNSENAPVHGYFSSETIRVPVESLSDKPVGFKIVTCVEKCVNGRRIPLVLPDDSAYVNWLIKRLESMEIRVLDCVYQGTCRRDVSHGKLVSTVYPTVFIGQISGPSDAMHDLFIHGIGHNGAFGAAFANLII